MRNSLAYSYLCIVCCLVGFPVATFAQATPTVPATTEPDAAASDAPASVAEVAPATPDVDAAAPEAPAIEAATGRENDEVSGDQGKEPESVATEPAAQELRASNQSDLASPAAPLPAPGDFAARLEQGDAFDGQDTWTAPVPVFALHGYMRMRGELMDTFWLGRNSVESLEGADNVESGSLGADPFNRFQPYERAVDNQCVGESKLPGDGSGCDVDSLQFANIRLRLSPELNLTEDVRVKATFDVFDNVVAGRTPRSFYGASTSSTFAGTLDPEGAGASSIVARRAWAEVRNRDLGELRFGRMPRHWGLGMRYNAGNGLDQDFSTDMDSLLGILKVSDFISDSSFGGIYVTASYDFIAEGIPYAQETVTRPDFDASQQDDVDQFTFSVARRTAEDDEADMLERGELVLNGGLTFELRNQDAILTQGGMQTDAHVLHDVSMTRYTPDLWVQLKGPFGRIEAEVAYAFGTLKDSDGNESSISQLGAAVESEFRFLEDKLALHFDTGFASGDREIEGLSALTDFTGFNPGQPNGTVSTYSFHPSYQVDMILWRNIMRQVSGAYYFKPGLSYDFVRTDFGELFGLRADVIWSRATSALQTPGNASDLGVELNAEIYWRSEDGTELTDGYHASLQYGVLFPLAGLGVPDGSTSIDVDLDYAQQLRLVLGVVF